MLLISKGADVNAKDSNFSTPLHNAAFYGKKEVADLLISKGADVQAKDNKGRTPFDRHPFLDQLTPDEKALYERKVNGDPLLEKKFIATRKFLREFRSSGKAPRFTDDIDIIYTLNKDERTILFDALIEQSSEGR